MWRGTILVVALALSGCDDLGGPAFDGGATTPDGSVGGESDAFVSLVTTTVGKSFWYGGFKVTLGEARFGFEGGTTGRVVTIASTFENLGTDTADFVAELVIQTPGRNYVASEYAQTGAPKVPGRTTGTGTLVVPIDTTSFAFQSATLIVGTAANNQARVPLDGTGTLVDLAPRTLALTGTISASTLKLTAAGADLRYDVPSKHREIAAGKLGLTVAFSVLFDSDFGGGYLFNGNSLALRLPDGSLLGADEAPSEIIGPRRSLVDQRVRFLVSSAAAGKYSLVLIHTEDKKQGELALAIP